MIYHCQFEIIHDDVYPWSGVCVSYYDAKDALNTLHALKDMFMFSFEQAHSSIVLRYGPNKDHRMTAMFTTRAYHTRIHALMEARKFNEIKDTLALHLYDLSGNIISESHVHSLLPHLQVRRK